ncbi:hypothetical protein BLOT_012522 [Blomia tropicalis]|nr:hypothetical protein BLOT_012522 [Blomia tropicalis]
MTNVCSYRNFTSMTPDMSSSTLGVRTIMNPINYGTKSNQHGNQLFIIVPLLSIIVLLNFAICSPTNNQGINKKVIKFLFNSKGKDF